MADNHHERLERELDAALSKYSAVEPRAGLEERILANLRAEQARVPNRAWWRWSAALVAVVIILAMVVALRPGRRHEDGTARQAPPAIQNPTQPETQLVATRVDHGTAKAARVAPRAPAKHSIHPAVSAPPKLDRFPSPQPLSEQERMLARYVADYPQRAALLAEARMEALRQDAQERAAIVNGDQDWQHEIK